MFDIIKLVCENIIKSYTTTTIQLYYKLKNQHRHFKITTNFIFCNILITRKFIL